MVVNRRTIIGNMAKIEPNAVIVLILTCGCYGMYAQILTPTSGNWTWSDAYQHCQESNSRLAYMDEITLPIKISDTDIVENDAVFWINNKTSEIKYPCGCLDADVVDKNDSIKHVGSVLECSLHCKVFPQFAVMDSNCSCDVNIICNQNQSTCADQYQIYKREESEEICLLVFKNSSKVELSAKFVSCKMKAGSICRTDIIKAMQGTKFTWYQARTLCQNASSNLVDLSLVGDIERNRSIGVVNSRYYWTNGVIKHGKAGVFHITDCVQANGLLDKNKINMEWNSVYTCKRRCQDSDQIALMDDQCVCLMESDNLKRWRTSGCTIPCIGNTRDRCGGNGCFSVYRLAPEDQEQALDSCLAITKNSDNNITKPWRSCGQHLDGCICRNGTNDINFVIKTKNLTWEGAQKECESNGMILAIFEEGHISERSEIHEGANLWTGTYSPTILEFSTETEIQNDDKCLAVTNFGEQEYNVDVLDCFQNLGVICHNNNGTFFDVTTLPCEGSEHMTSDENTPDAASVRTKTSSTVSVTTELPHAGLSPMIIGLICTVVFVAVVLTIILGVLAVLLYRFKEQKRQLNMLKGPTISYSNLEHSVVVSYNETTDKEDSGDDIGNLDNVTEQMDALFVRNDEMSPDEKSEHLYDVSDNVNIELPEKQQNGTVLNTRGETQEMEEGEYTEVDICKESGNPAVVTNGDSKTPREDKNMENSFKSNNEQGKFSLTKVPEIHNENFEKDDKSDDKERDIDDDYDHTDSYVRRCKRQSDTDTYDELNMKSCKRPGSRSEGLYDRVGSDNYDELKTGVAAKPKIHYEDIELPNEIP